MALLAEELVEEWLNRQGYFTIRGIKLGVDEIDLLAIKFNVDGSVICRHIEVQASMRPIGYISRLPIAHRASNQSGSSAKTRTDLELRDGVKEWVQKKYQRPKKVELFKKLFPKAWSSELVHNNVKSEIELKMIQEEGIDLISLPFVIKQLNDESFTIKSAGGADFADLIHLAGQNI